MISTHNVLLIVGVALWAMGLSFWKSPPFINGVSVGRVAAIIGTMLTTLAGIIIEADGVIHQPLVLFLTFVLGAGAGVLMFTFIGVRSERPRSGDLNRVA